jgi:ABC-type branched-subunit amino acid transport system permease subunit
MTVPRRLIIGFLAFVVTGILAPVLPAWLVSLATVAFANALVVLGLILLWRAGLVPFGQALFYAIGAYAVALIGRYTPVRDAFALIAAGALLACLVAFLVGFLLARYREIFFSMLSLAMSMILYGALVKTETLGSTDGFGVEPPTYLGYTPEGAMQQLVLFWLVLAFGAGAALGVFLYCRSIAGALAVPVRDNEIRLEFLGVSVNRLVHFNLMIAGTLAGIGGALAAMAIEHVDPNMAYWTTSGGFVFVTILAGAGTIAAAFVGSFVFELLKSIAYDLLPGTWQIFLGAALLVTILFLPDGLGSLFVRLRHPSRQSKGAAP